jgi:hypothetical protein
MAECDGQHIGHLGGNVDVLDASARAHVGPTWAFMMT